MKLFKFLILFIVLSFIFIGCGGATKENKETVEQSKDSELLDLVQRKTFNYFWNGAEPISGLARERFHVDGEYPMNDKEIVTSGGSGFGIMALLVGIERGYVTREEGLARFDRILTFLEKADSFHGVFPHWWEGQTGKVKGFSDKDNGGDLVETSFLIQGLLTAHQYFVKGNEAEKVLASRIDAIWRNVDWNWHRNEQNVLYWHWSPSHSWEMNFAIRGFNECLITYVLAASSPTHGVPAEVYHEGWANNGAIVSPHELEGHKLNLHYESVSGSGPMFWAHYSFLGLDPTGLQDKYANYFEEMRNYTLINHDYCVRNPKGYKGYNENSWGLSASYSVNGYSAHEPLTNDLGVIAPTAALSSIVYTPEESMKVVKYLAAKGDTIMGDYGFYDAYSETENWYPQRYLAIDQGPIVVMIENYRTQMLWNLFMSHPDVQKGLLKLGFQSPHLN